MALSKSDIEAIGVLIDQRIDEGFAMLKEEVREFRDEVNESFDFLFKQEETRQQEMLVSNEQFQRMEKAIEAHGSRIKALESVN